MFPTSKIKQKYVVSLSNIMKGGNLLRFDKNEIPENEISFSKSKRRTDLFQRLVFEESSFYGRYWLLVKNFHSVHFAAILLCYLSILIQNFYPQSCLLYPTCVCHNDLAIKFYTLIKEVLSFWLITVALVYNTIFHLKEMNKKLLKFVFIVLDLVIIGYYYLKDNGPKELDGNIFTILGSFVFIQHSFYIVYFFMIQRKIKIFIIKFMEATSLLYLIFFNNIFCFWFLGSINQSLKSNFDSLIATNVIRILLIIYLFIFRYLGIKCLWFYYQLLSKETNDQSTFDMRMTLWGRNVLCYISTVNVLAITRADLSEWTSWILFADYVIFLIQGYTSFL